MLKQMDAPTVSQGLVEILVHPGIPKELLTEKVSEFTGKIMRRHELQLQTILCQDACQRLMLLTSLPQEQVAKTSMVSEVRIQVFIIPYS